MQLNEGSVMKLRTRRRGGREKKTKAAIMLTDNRPVNYLSDNISAGAVWLAINCIVKVALWRGVFERGASPLFVCVFVFFFVFGIMPVYDKQHNIAK